MELIYTYSVRNLTECDMGVHLTTIPLTTHIGQLPHPPTYVFIRTSIKLSPQCTLKIVSDVPKRNSVIFTIAQPNPVKPDSRVQGRARTIICLAVRLHSD